MDKLNICKTILEKFNVATDTSVEDIANFKEHKSQLYAYGPVYAFDFKDSHYYVVEDYSLDENPELVKNILLDINNLLKGEIVKNPKPDSEFPYSVDLDGRTYYLWKTVKN